MPNADKRIPVTEERHQALHDLKSAGQTYDELLAELIDVYKKKQEQDRRLAAMVREKRAEGSFEEVDPETW